jgi:hypothetical protein
VRALILPSWRSLSTVDGEEDRPRRIGAPLAHERFEVHHQAKAAVLVRDERLAVEGLVEVEDQAIRAPLTERLGDVEKLAADDRRFPLEDPGRGPGGARQGARASGPR